MANVDERRGRREPEKNPSTSPQQIPQQVDVNYTSIKQLRVKKKIRFQDGFVVSLKKIH